MSSHPQPDVPVPTPEAGNQADESQQPAPPNYTMNVQQRACKAVTMRNDIRTMGLRPSSGQIFTEAFKLLTLCTFRVHEFSSSQNTAEASYRRDLFGCCQYAFSRLDVSISRRLLGRRLTERVLSGDLTVDLHTLEQKLSTVGGHGQPPNIMMSEDQNLRHKCAKEALHRLQHTDFKEPRSVELVELLVHLAVNAKINAFPWDDGHTDDVPALTSTTMVKKKVWERDVMFEYAAWALILMASCVAKIYNGQTVELWGQRVPEAYFRTEDSSRLVACR